MLQTAFHTLAILKHGYQLHEVHCLDSITTISGLKMCLVVTGRSLVTRLVHIKKRQMTGFSICSWVYSYGEMIHPLI